MGSVMGDFWKTFAGQSDYKAPELDYARANQAAAYQDPLRQQQGQYNAWLQSAMTGGGPVAAERQNEINRAQAAAASQAASARGGNVALANRIQGQQAAAGLAGAQANANKLQMGYGEQYGSALSNQRTAEQEQQRLEQARIDQELQRQKTIQETKAQNAKGEQQALGTTLSTAGSLLALSDIRAKENVRPMYSDFMMKEPTQQDLFEMQAQRDREDEERRRRMLETRPAPEEEQAKSGVNAGMIAGMLSDYTAKESRLDLSPIRPVNYQYKPEAAARMALETGATPAERRMVYADKRTPRNGIIAQDLEKSPAFDDSVIDTPAGKAVDRDRALSEALAQMAALDKRLRSIEGRGSR